MRYRNPKYVHDGNIDCEIKHPVLGWILYTATPNDPEPTGKALYEQIISDGDIDAADPAPIVNYSSIDKRQLYKQLVVVGKWDTLKTALSSNITLSDYFDSAWIFKIDDPEVIAMAATLEEDLQAFFNAAYKL